MMLVGIQCLSSCGSVFLENPDSGSDYLELDRRHYGIRVKNGGSTFSIWTCSPNVKLTMVCSTLPRALRCVAQQQHWANGFFHLNIWGVTLLILRQLVCLTVSVRNICCISSGRTRQCLSQCHPRTLVDTQIKFVRKKRMKFYGLCCRFICISDWLYKKKSVNQHIQDTLELLSLCLFNQCHIWRQTNYIFIWPQIRRVNLISCLTDKVQIILLS